MPSGDPVMTVGKEAGHASPEHRADGPRDRFVSRRSVVVIDTREAVHLQIDPARRDVVGVA